MVAPGFHPQNLLAMSFEKLEYDYQVQRMAQAAAFHRLKLSR